VDNSRFHSLPSTWLQENALFSNHEKHNSAITEHCSSSKGKQGCDTLSIFLFHYTVVESFSIKIVAGNGGYETCRPRAGSRFNISSSGIYLSSNSSRDQAADYDLKNMVQHSNIVALMCTRNCHMDRKSVADPRKYVREGKNVLSGIIFFTKWGQITH
jgi:hypothetical protein